MVVMLWIIFMYEKVHYQSDINISSKEIWVCHLGTKHNIVDFFLPEEYKVVNN